jgi:transforming growth factor-beta-induced protein
MNLTFTPTLSNLLRVLAALLMTSLLAACDSDDDNRDPEPVTEQAPPAADPGPGTIVEVASGSDDFETLVAALQATGLDSTLADEAATFTVFAPTDAAFDLLGQDTIDALLSDTDTLSDILLYHVIGEQAVPAETALSLAGSTVDMANGGKVALTLRDGALFINESEVVSTDIDASNGIIHVIDAVLIPSEVSEPTGNIVETAVAAGDFTTLVTAVQAAGLDTALADPDATYTVFAPTDAAFEALGSETINGLLADIAALTNVLLYHVVNDAAVDSITATSLLGQEVEMFNEDTTVIDIRDGELFINDAKVITKDIGTTNGIIHVIDAVLLPPAEEPVDSITEVAVADGRFTTLVAALQATELDAVLADETATFTVFAPTDDAFAALGQETIDGLLADTDTLSDILLYHVLADQAVDAETALTLDGSSVEMANGDSVTLTVDGDRLFINEAEVIITDVTAANGIIHVIDAVLTPPAS